MRLRLLMHREEKSSFCECLIKISRIVGEVLEACLVFQLGKF
jgi:hypothetical protein